MNYNCHCSICGLEARSKCPQTRSIFAADEMDAMFSHMFIVDVDDTGHPYLKQRFVAAEDSAYELRRQLLERIAWYINASTAEVLACHHDFVINDDQACIFGCCKGHQYQAEELRAARTQLIEAIADNAAAGDRGK
jgi:hypothetical protein